MECVNERYVTTAAYDQASKGIIDPEKTIIASGLIYRFGASLENAKTGSWWLDAAQYQRVEGWAAANGLAVPLAARILSGVLHEWGARSVLGSNMRILVRAQVKRPLRAYKGIAKSQNHSDEKGILKEAMDPTPVNLGSGIVQLYIPGLDQPTLDSATLEFGAPVIYDVGASHIFGVPLVPAGTAMN